jgi:hypothetical protein
MDSRSAVAAGFCTCFTNSRNRIIYLVETNTRKLHKDILYGMRRAKNKLDKNKKALADDQA